MRLASEAAKLLRLPFDERRISLVRFNHHKMAAQKAVASQCPCHIEIYVYLWTPRTSVAMPSVGAGHCCKLMMMRVVT